jgi:hypothetical protein
MIALCFFSASERMSFIVFSLAGRHIETGLCGMSGMGENV